MPELTHFDESGASRMVDVAGQADDFADGPSEWPDSGRARNSWLDRGSRDGQG